MATRASLAKEGHGRGRDPPSTAPGGSPVIEAGEAGCARQIHRFQIVDAKSAGLDQRRDIPFKVATTASPPPKWIETILPPSNRLVWGLAVLAEDQPPARLQDSTHTFQSSYCIGDSAKRVGDKDGVHTFRLHGIDAPGLAVSKVSYATLAKPSVRVPFGGHAAIPGVTSL